MIEVGGRPIHHEVVGSGPPVVLLHGGMSGASSWESHPQALADAGFRAFVPERRGHGRTPDVDEPLTYAGMAGDTITYLDHVVRDPAPLIGWSDGAVVALLVALRRPDLVSGLVLIGQYYNRTGRVAGGILEAVRDPGTEGYLRERYLAEQPDGDFDAFFARTLAMWDAEPELDLALLAGVRAPTLVLQGDRDDVTLAHSAAVADALPRGRLAVLPGSHLLPVEQPALVSALLLWFLGGGAGAHSPV